MRTLKLDLFVPPSPPSSCRSDGGFQGSGGGSGSRFFGGRRTAVLAAPDTPTRRRTSKPLMNLHWDVLPPANIERTVWAQAAVRKAESVDDAEIQELEKLFSKKVATSTLPGGLRRSTMGGADATRGNGGPSAVEGKGRAGSGRGGYLGTNGGGRVKKMYLLEVSRGNNVAIGLKAFKREGGVSELARLVGGLDPDGEGLLGSGQSA